MKVIGPPGVKVAPTVISEIWPKQSAAGPQASPGPVAFTSLIVTGVPSGVSGMSADVASGSFLDTVVPVTTVSPSGSTYSATCSATARRRWSSSCA